MGNLHGNPANFQHNEGSWETWLRTAVARVLVIGWENKLAVVLEQLLGVKKYKRVLENSAGKASNDKAKKPTA